MMIRRIFCRGFAAWALLALAIPASTAAGSRDPFPLGRGMMSQGAIVEAEGASGREPWAPAAFYRDTLRWGAAAAAVSYHGGDVAARYAAGGFGVIGPVVCKAALAQLDAMGIYYEQTIGLSAGSSWRWLSFGFGAQVDRIGLYDRAPDTRTSMTADAALLIQTRRIGASAAASGLTLLSGGDPDAAPAPQITARVCTVRNRYGSQGAMITVTPDNEAPVRFALAQEYRIGKVFALSASIASNPTMIGFGISVDKSSASGSAAVVNHPFLGWSRGLAVDYSR